MSSWSELVGESRGRKQEYRPSSSGSHTGRATVSGGSPGMRIEEPGDSCGESEAPDRGVLLAPTPLSFLSANTNMVYSCFLTFYLGGWRYTDSRLGSPFFNFKFQQLAPARRRPSCEQVNKVEQTVRCPEFSHLTYHQPNQLEIHLGRFATQKQTVCARETEFLQGRS